MPDLAILTNAIAPDQRSMIGYGELLLDNARNAGLDVTEFRAMSPLGRIAASWPGNTALTKLAANIDRFATAPFAFAGRRADIVHVVDPGNVPYLDVIRHRASIVTVHDVIPYLCVAGRLDGFRPSRTGRWLMRRILKRLERVDRIVCVSDCTRRDLLSLAPIDPGRVEVIPNAVFQPMHRATEAECRALRTRLGLPAQGPIVLHVGSNIFYKNRAGVVDVFARIAPMIPDAALLFVGPRTPDLMARLAAAGIADRVHFALAVPREDMATVYSMASVLLFPSLYEGFGYPVLEAQLCGTPVVCSRTGALAETGAAGAMLHDPGDATSMAISVAELLLNKLAATALVAAGKRNALQFTVSEWRRLHARLYQDFCRHQRQNQSTYKMLNS
jgi:glycosyltransferase involved in cell wall biosynthesis